MLPVPPPHPLNTEEERLNSSAHMKHTAEMRCYSPQPRSLLSTEPKLSGSGEEQPGPSHPISSPPSPPGLQLPNHHLCATASSGSHRNRGQGGLTHVQPLLLLSSKAATPRGQEHAVCSVTPSTPGRQRAAPRCSPSGAPPRGPGQATRQLTTQRRIKQSAKQTDSVNPQITNCLHVSGWLMGRENSRASLVSCRATVTQPPDPQPPHPAPLTLAISSCSSSSVCSDSGRGKEPSLSSGNAPSPGRRWAGRGEAGRERGGRPHLSSPRCAWAPSRA